MAESREIAKNKDAGMADANKKRIDLNLSLSLKWYCEPLVIKLLGTDVKIKQPAE